MLVPEWPVLRYKSTQRVQIMDTGKIDVEKHKDGLDSFLHRLLRKEAGMARRRMGPTN